MIGKLRDRVAIQQRSKTTSANGETVSTYATVATRWACVEDQGGAEITQANQQVAQRSVKVTLRYYSGLSAQHRFVFGSRTLNVQSVTADQQRIWHTCMCMEEP